MHPCSFLVYLCLNMTVQLLAHLQTALSLLAIPANSSLAIDLQTATTRANRAAYQIAVFGDFNHGKSTLLNAILGSKALPIDLIPTTGGAIKVVYGAEIVTTITLTSGEVIQQNGTDILQEFAVLDGDRRMRSDVAKIDVSYPHPLLELGVELIDLPGTNDREEQDDLVRTQLLAADLVIYVLDTRKLMTLGEREHLRDWLEQRGINTVVFVANFTNMLEPADRQAVQQRLRFVAESFRSQLPAGISNLYRVDALPALRARLKGDDQLLHTSGLTTLVSALQTILDHRSDTSNQGSQILPPLVNQVTGLLQKEIDRLTQEIATVATKQTQTIQLQQQASQLIQAGWQKSLQGLEEWLHLPTLISSYQTTLVPAIQRDAVASWEQQYLSHPLYQFQSEINDWLVKLSQFFEIPTHQPLALSCPEPPEVELPPPTPETATSSTSSLGQLTPTALATGLGWVLGGPLGAAVVGGASLLVNQAGNNSDKSAVSCPDTATQAAYQEAAEDYLCRLNMEMIAHLNAYRSRTISCFDPPPMTQAIDSPAQQQLATYQQCLAQLAALR
jgi:GTPase SAR1 family protein